MTAVVLCRFSLGPYVLFSVLLSRTDLRLAKLKLSLSCERATSSVGSAEERHGPPLRIRTIFSNFTFLAKTKTPSRSARPVGVTRVFFTGANRKISASFGTRTLVSRSARNNLPLVFF